MSQSAPTYEYKRPGFALAVYHNRVEIVERKGIFPATSTTILTKTIATVVTTPIGGKLRLTLNDGSAHEYILGRQAEEAKNAILALL